MLRVQGIEALQGAGLVGSNAADVAAALKAEAGPDPLTQFQKKQVGDYLGGFRQP
eukprot:SAG31_NODE_12222_length_957_cov_20.146853_2_plen_55_part_00